MFEMRVHHATYADTMSTAYAMKCEKGSHHGLFLRLEYYKVVQI